MRARAALRGVIPGALLLAASACGARGRLNRSDAAVIPTFERPAAGVAQSWVTTPDRRLLLARGADMRLRQSDTSGGIPIDVDARVTYQSIVGFGAALTDASAWLIQTRLSPAQRTALLEELFGRRNGIGLSFTRLTIGASDFARAHYTFDDMPPGERDDSLARFSIAPNRGEVLPVVKQALAINPQLAVMATPWSAPAWMKTTGSLLKGTLRPDAYAAFAEYLRRYVDAYAAEGVPIFALSVQNEPDHEPDDYPGMRLGAAQRADFVANHLGPLFVRWKVRTRILDWDHNWDRPQSPLEVLADPAARQYVSGVAWHCYAGDVSAQSRVHEAHPDKDTYFTECSGGAWAPNWGDNLRWNVRTLVIGTTRHWARGVLLWNLALDAQHGPHVGGCTDCRGVVTIDSATGGVTRNEEFYALAHASRFVRPGARRIASTSGVDGVESVAFRNVDDSSKVLLVVNTTNEGRTLRVRDVARQFLAVLPAGAVATYTWR